MTMAVSGLSSLELGIIPFETAVPVFPLSGFRLYDGLVIVESIVQERHLTLTGNSSRVNPADVNASAAMTRPLTAPLKMRRDLDLPDTCPSQREGQFSGCILAGQMRTGCG